MRRNTKQASLQTASSPRRRPVSPSPPHACLTLMKLPMVREWPRVDVYTSCTPARDSIFLVAGAATRPVPRGAGMSRTRTDPQWPVSLLDTVWGAPTLLPQ